MFKWCLNIFSTWLTQSPSGLGYAGACGSMGRSPPGCSPHSALPHQSSPVTVNPFATHQIQGQVFKSNFVFSNNYVTFSYFCENLLSVDQFSSGVIKYLRLHVWYSDWSVSLSLAPFITVAGDLVEALLKYL